MSESRRGPASPSVMLAQLPLPDPQGFYDGGNVPVAAGCLKSYAVARAGFDSADIDILPRSLADRGGDAAVVDYIDRSGAGTVGFTCYLWNVERNLIISESLKRRRPGIRIVFGGPEMEENHPASFSSAVDEVIIGEGEAAFSRMLRNGTSRKSGEPSGPPENPNLARIPNPYLAGTLPLKKGETVFIESMRGCPHRCSFCFYSKNSSRVRLFPESRLQRIFLRAGEEESGKIYLMDPSFQAAPGLVTRLRRIAKWNRARIPIHTELRLDGITPASADALKAAGVRSVETGLQSVNPRALSAVHRSWDRSAFIAGARLLRDRGIEVRTGVIIGLPLDTPETIRETVDFVIDLGLAPHMEFYPLAVLPGTRLRAEAESFGLSHMERPPYWVTSHPELSTRDIQELIFWLEDTLDIDFYPAIAPSRNNPGDFTGFADLRERPEAVLKELDAAPEKLANRLTLVIFPHTPLPILRGLAERIKRSSPQTLIQIVIDSDLPPPHEWTRSVRAGFDSGPVYFDRIHYFAADPQRTFSTRLFHLTGNLDTARRISVTPGPCDLILRFRPGSMESAPDLMEDFPILWIEREVRADEREALRRRYRAFPHLLLFPPQDSGREHPD